MKIIRSKRLNLLKESTVMLLLVLLIHQPSILIAVMRHSLEFSS